MPGLTELNAMSPHDAKVVLLECCGSVRWADAMTAARPFTDVHVAYTEADRLWNGLQPDDWREAFAGHPRIGERKRQDATPHTKRTAAWSAQEQATAATTNDATEAALAAVNREYEARFHRVYLVHASGRSAEELLADARKRLRNDAATELRVAAEEQRRITRSRLTRLLEGNE